MFLRRYFWNARAHSRACALSHLSSSGAIGQRAVLIQQYPAELCRGCEFKPHLEQPLTSSFCIIQLINEAQICSYRYIVVLSKMVIMVTLDLTYFM